MGMKTAPLFQTDPKRKFSEFCCTRQEANPPTECVDAIIANYFIPLYGLFYRYKSEVSVKVVVHAGMHKTGSSSIQDTFGNIETPAFHYVRHRGTNHGSLFVLLFQDVNKLTNYRGFSTQGLNLETLLEHRQKAKATLDQELEENQRPIVVISAEAVSGPQMKFAASALHTYLQERFDEIQLIVYVRPPHSCIRSIFQQQLKSNGLASFNLAPRWPNYKARFEHLFEIFGKENVSIKAYDKMRLVNGDVIDDFASQIDFPIRDDQKKHSNISLSLEATALLYAQRKLGKGLVRGFPGAQHANKKFINDLTQIGNTKFAFAPDLVNPIIEANRSELEWMEKQLGVPLLDSSETKGRVISSEDELLSVANENLPQLEELLGISTYAEERNPRERVLDNLEKLRKIHYP